jgi:prephenate dehydrogenase
MFEQLALIGCGLMGGSFALALRRAGLVQHVCGFSPSPATTARALALGVIDRVASSPAEAVARADLVLVAVPISATGVTLESIGEALQADALVMDVGSTKSAVIEAAAHALQHKRGQFVPAHPIAGKELAGVDHADADLYSGRQVILTPTADTDPTQVLRAHTVWTALGAQVIEMAPDAHDAAYAAVSHLPHMLAFALMNALQDQVQGEAFLSLAGPGFRDFTRIAASDPSVWRDILLTNREELLAQSRHFQQALLDFDAAIARGDPAELRRLIERASHRRSQWRLSAPQRSS